jgi:signal transduction histidine kinase
MRSLRLSLTVYFLALSAAALGTAWWFVYRIAAQNLEDKRRTTAQLLDTQYRKRCRDEEAGRDQALLVQAQTLARLTLFQFDRSQMRFRELHVLGGLTTALAPNGYLVTPSWALQGLRGPFFYELHHRNVAAIKLNTSEILRDPDSQVAEYFQINDGHGSAYRSESLGQRSLPLDARTFAPGQLVHWDWDDIKLDPDTPLRRVVFRASAARMITLEPFPYRSWGPWPSRPQPPPGGTGPREVPLGPTIIVQCAYDSRKRDAALQTFREQHEAELTQLEQDAATELGGLRRKLLLISSATFAAAVLGCWGLVRLGLAPLRRLSEAVGKVSPRDFRLPFNEPRLPQELRPIVEHLSGTLIQLRRAFAREKQATADLSHELRTPLAALLATIELALRKPRDAAAYRELIGECHRSAQQMHTIVERLLTLARLDAGAERVRTRPTDVGVLAAQAAALVQPLAQAHGVQLGVHVDDPDGLCAVTDPDKLREIVLNLLHNAVQYNRPAELGGGRVDLSVDRDPQGLVVEVRDTGVGITAEAREHLFERFYRGDPSRSGDGLHAGLGLALVKEYLDLLKGDIEVESVVGRGTTFRVHLPQKAV